MSIPSWARVGAKVVMVDGSPAKHGNGIAQVGDICEILETRLFGGVGTCRVREVNGRYCSTWMEWTRISRFRPLVTLEDDMAAHFTRLLDAPAPTERERA